MKLTNPTDEELNAAFAEHVCGNPVTFETGAAMIKVPCNTPGFDAFQAIPAFTKSADLVLPWLEKPFGKGKEFSVYIRFTDVNQYWHVDIIDKISYRRDCHMFHGLPAETLSKSAIIALLRAHGIEVELTS